MTEPDLLDWGSAPAVVGGAAVVGVAGVVLAGVFARVYIDGGGGAGGGGSGVADTLGDGADHAGGVGNAVAGHVVAGEGDRALLAAADALELALGDGHGVALVADAPGVKDLVGDGEAGAAVGLVFGSPIQELPGLFGVFAGGLAAPGGEQAEDLVEDGAVNVVVHRLGLGEVALEAGAERAHLAKIIGVALVVQGAVLGVDGVGVGVEGFVDDLDEGVAFEIGGAEGVEGGFGGGARGGGCCGRRGASGRGGCGGQCGRGGRSLGHKRTDG